MEPAFDAFVAIDEQGLITDWNPAAEHLFGWSREDVLGRNLTATWIAEADRERVGVELREIVEGKQRDVLGRRVQLSALARDGSPIPIEITAWVERDGRRFRLNSFVRDLRERTRADEVRRLLAAVVESSDDAIITKTLDGVITSWNEGAHRLLGYSAEEAVGRPITILIPEDRLDEERYILEQLRQGKRIDHYETIRVTKDGRLLHVALTISPVHDASGAIIGVSKILRDITERKLVEQSLRDERRLLERLNRAGIALAASNDLTELLRGLADAATQMSGAEFGAFFYRGMEQDGDRFRLISSSGPLKDAFEALGPPHENPLLAPPDFESREVIRVDDVRADRSFGPQPSALGVRSYLAVPVVSRAGDVLGGLLFGHSRAGVFTERVERFIRGLASHAAIAIENTQLLEERTVLLESERAARTEAERVNASKDEFLATLSHELRTPLNSILGWTHILRSTQDPNEVSHGMDVIERNVRAQTRLVDDLMDVSRIVSGQMRLDVQTLMPVAFVQAAIDALAPTAETRKVRVDSELDPNAGPVSGDPGRLQQVVWNLVSNAIKFTPAGGRVRVTLARVDSQIEIGVSDSGIGISPDLLPHVFERFRQGDSSMTRRHGGLGIGLAIVKHIVERHGGHVVATSGGEDQGATFRVELPVAVVLRIDEAERRHPRSESAVSAAAAVADLSGLRVLAVDDEIDARVLIERVLENRGAEVSTAASGAEALARVEVERPDVLVCDIGMPDMNGYELLRRIRALGPDRGGRVQAIALTAFARSEDRTRAMMAGFLAHVAKPVEPTELIATVASVAGRTG
jgi:PAS domain S-box-containing protein